MSLKERIIKDIKSYQKSYKFVLYKAFFELTEDGVVVFDDIAEYFKKFYLERSINGLPVEESDAAPLISNISSNTPIDKIKTHLRNLPIKYNNFLRLDNDMVYMEQENWSQLNRHDIEEIISIINTTIESYYRGVEDMSEAKNIFLVIGDDTNYSRTITDFIDITKYKDIISETDYNNLMSIYPSGKMQCWGFQDNQSKNRCWDNMRYGDLCLMYNNSKIVMSGIVTYTLHSVKLSEEIWIQGDTPFEYIFCLNDVHILSIPSEKVLIDEFNYKRAYTLGASALSDEKFNRLIKEYGSISNFRKHIEDGDYKHISSNNNVQLNDKEKKKVNTKHLLFDFDIKDIVVGITNYISSKGFTYPPGLIENFYLSLKTKPFVLLAGVSGTGKTKLVKLFAEAIGCTEENGQFKMISVRPDWSDSSDLLGYKNIRDKFQPGPMIEVLQDAAANPDDIYFV
ncbi:MAG: hypothetical protein ACOCRK_12055, partial [bacterium]